MQIYAMWKINLVVEASSDYNSGEFCPMQCNGKNCGYGDDSGNNDGRKNGIAMIALNIVCLLD